VNVDRSKEVDQILSAAKARSPHSLKAAPSWFSGKELDLLEPIERDRLYWELRLRTRPNWWALFAIAMANLPNLILGFHLERRPGLWKIVAAGALLAIAAAWFSRRWGILAAARRDVRERADWPLRMWSRRS
jgi:hypothetical protein